MAAKRKMNRGVLIGVITGCVLFIIYMIYMIFLNEESLEEETIDEQPGNSSMVISNNSDIKKDHFIYPLV